MFGIGLLELVIILVFGLVFIGPNRLPKLARQFGRFFVQIRRMTTDVRSTIDDAVRQAEHDLLQEEREKLKSLLSDGQKEAEKAARDLMNETGSIHQDDNNPALDTKKDWE